MTIAELKVLRKKKMYRIDTSGVDQAPTVTKLVSFKKSDLFSLAVVGGYEGSWKYAHRFKRVPSPCNSPVAGLTD